MIFIAFVIKNTMPYQGVPVVEQKVLPEYDVKILPLSDLKDHPQNPRVIKDNALKGLVASIEKFGLIEPIIFNKRTGYIVGGHQRKKALEAAGYTTAQVLIVDFDEDTEMMANMSLNNPRIQGEFTDGAGDLLVHYEELYPEASRELMLHDLKLDLVGEEGASKGLNAADPLYKPEDVIETAARWFREKGFPYQSIPKHIAMQQMNRLAAMTGEEAIRSNWANHVPDHYNPHRYHERAAGKKSVFDYFQDDKWLRQALKAEYEMGGSIPDGYFGFMNMTAGSQTLANFRAGFAMYLYRKYGKPGGVVLDPCTGYGGRLVGWHCSRLGGQYIGVDPASKTSAGNRAMADDLGFKGVTLIQKPFEDSAMDIMNALKGTDGVDFAFTSPPYFSKEKYSEEETQSWVRYKTIDTWRDGFLFPMFKICESVMKAGAVLAINIADVNVNGKTIPLEEMTVAAGRESGLPLEQTLRFDLPHRTGTHAAKFEASEPVFIFRKPA